MPEHDGFPVVLDIDPAQKRLKVIKYGAILTVLNLAIVGILLAIFGFELPWLGRPLEALHVKIGLKKLLVLLILSDVATSRELWVSLFSRVIVHRDCLDVFAAMRRRTVYFVEVERVEAIAHKGATIAVLWLAGGRALPILDPAGAGPRSNGSCRRPR